jgi:hypothetical protein
MAIARARAALSRTIAAYERARAAHLDTAEVFERSGDAQTAGRHRDAAVTCALARDRAARRLEVAIRADDVAAWDEAPVADPVALGDTLEAIVSRGAIADHPCPICGAEAAVVLTATTVLCPECGQLAQVIGGFRAGCTRHEWTQVYDQDHSVVGEQCGVCGEARPVNRG